MRNEMYNKFINGDFASFKFKTSGTIFKENLKNKDSGNSIFISKNRIDPLYEVVNHLKFKPELDLEISSSKAILNHSFSPMVVANFTKPRLDFVTIVKFMSKDYRPINVDGFDDIRNMDDIFILSEKVNDMIEEKYNDSCYTIVIQIGRLCGKSITHDSIATAYQYTVALYDGRMSRPDTKSLLLDSIVNSVSARLIKKTFIKNKTYDLITYGIRPPYKIEFEELFKDVDKEREMLKVIKSDNITPEALIDRLKNQYRFKLSGNGRPKMEVLRLGIDEIKKSSKSKEIDI